MLKHLTLLIILLVPVCFLNAVPYKTTSLKEADQATLHGKYAEAIKLYQEIVKRNPANYPAYLRLARVYLETGKYVDCQQTYETMLQKLPDNAEARTGLAELSFLLGDYDKTSRLLTKLRETEPNHLKALNLSCQLYLQVGKYDEAEETARFFTTLKKEDTDRFSANQLLELARGLWFYATRVGQKNIFHRVNSEILPYIESLSQDNPALYAFWGSCYLAKGAPASAKDCFKDALKTNPNYAQAVLGLAYCQPEADLGMPAAEKALSINPKLIQARKFLATVHLVNEQYEKAFDEINQALAINPNEISLQGTCASIYYLNNDLKEFEAKCEGILYINPKPAVFYYILGNNSVSRMHYLDAQSFYRKAVKFDPKFWDAHIALGLNCMRSGAEAEKEGRQLLTEAFKRDPFNLLVCNYLKLLDTLEKEYRSITSKHFTIKLHQSEQELLAPYVVPLLEKAYEKLTRLYKFKPKGPLLCEIFPSRSDFSVRMAGLPSIRYALGVAFAKTFLVYSPKLREKLGRPFHWGAITVHEFTHIITLQLSKFRVPRWFTEGCSVYAEKQLGWGRELERQIYEAYQAGQLHHLDKFCQMRGFDLLHTYLLSSLIIEYIHQNYGMDKIIKMLKAFAKHKKQDEVFKECLGKSLKEFDREFFDYFENTWLPGHIKLRKKVKPESEYEWRVKVRDNPEDTEALAKLAQLDLLKDDLLTAQLYAEKALELDPKHTQALLAMGDIFYTKKRYTKVIKYYSQAVKSGADDFATHFHLAKSYLKEDQPDEAVTAFQKAKQAFPAYVKQNDNPYHYLASIYESRGETKPMVRELEQLVKINHNDFSTRLKLAKLYWTQDRVETMIERLEETTYIEPANLTLHSWLATAYKSEKKYQKALQEYRIVVFLLTGLRASSERDAKLSQYHCKQAEVYIELGHLAQARASVKSALKYDSTNQKAWSLDHRLDKE